MPIFRLADGLATRLQAQTGFIRLEKGLQGFVERNLETLLGIRLVASEFSTGSTHRGRIDTLALDADGTPVIIEFKEIESDSVISQGLFYLAWLIEHKGDFEQAAAKALGPDLDVDWSQPRVILLAQSFNRYDPVAVSVVSTRIELWTYQMFGEEILDLRRLNADADGAQRRVATKAPKTLAQSSLDAPDLAQHRKSMSPETSALFDKLRGKVLAFGDDIEERYMKQTINYRHSRNFCEVVPQKKDLVLGFDADQLDDPRKVLRDMKGVGSWTTGRWQFRLASAADLEYGVGLAEQSYNRTK